MSGDGRIIAGWGGFASDYWGWTVNIDKVKVCHNNKKSIEVAFPHSMEEHLAHDDTLGPCTE